MKPTYKIVMLKELGPTHSRKEDITRQFNGLVSSLSVTSQFGKSSDSFTIEMVNPGFKLEFPIFGRRLEISLGYDNHLFRFGDFHVTDFTVTGQPDTLSINGTSTRFGGVIFNPRTKNFKSAKTLTDILKEIAIDAGLRAKLDFEATNVKPLYKTMKNESYMNFLTRISAAHNCQFKIEGDLLYFVDKRKEKTFSGAINNPINISLTDCEKFSIKYSERDNIKNVSAVWHDLETGKYSEIKDIADKKRSGEVFRIAGNFTSEKAAKAAIRRFKLERSNQHQELTFTVLGNPDIRAASRIKTDRTFNSRFVREWFVNRAVHTLDGSGYKTQVTAVPLGDLKAEKKQD